MNLKLTGSHFQMGIFYWLLFLDRDTHGASQVALWNLPADAGDTDSTPGSGRSPGEGNGNPLQNSCLENPMDGGAWQAIVHGVAKSQTWLSDCIVIVQSPLTAFLCFSISHFSD